MVGPKSSIYTANQLCYGWGKIRLDSSEGDSAGRDTDFRGKAEVMPLPQKQAGVPCKFANALFPFTSIVKHSHTWRPEFADQKWCHKPRETILTHFNVKPHLGTAGLN